MFRHVPNALTGSRLLLAAVFFVMLGYYQYEGRGDPTLLNVAFVIYCVALFTDFLDGYLARKLDQVTRLGQLLDPAADRLFIFATLLGLAARDVVPWWVVIAIVARDMMLLVLGVVLANHGYGPLPVHFLGKMATACLFYALPLLVLAQAIPATASLAGPAGWAAAAWGAFLYWWAGIVYGIETARVVRIPRDEGGNPSARVLR